MTRPQLRYADVAATVALVLALGGGAYAATSLPAGSVGSRQLARGAATPEKLSFPVGLAQATGTAQPTLVAAGGCGAMSCPPAGPSPILTATVKLTRASQVLVYGRVTATATGSSDLGVSAGVGGQRPSVELAEQRVTGNATVGGAATLSLPAGVQRISLYAQVYGGAPVQLSSPSPSALTVVALPQLRP